MSSMTSSTATLLHFNDLNEGSTSASIIDTSRVKEKIVVSKLVISCVWRPLFYLLISFQPGDIVLVVYEPKYSQHILYSTTQTIYFLHNDSLHDFQLKKTDVHARILAQLCEKEYCQAKKSVNRYNVPLGCKFFRVRITKVHLKRSRLS